MAAVVPERARPSYEELEETVRTLRAEIDRLRDEIRRIRRDQAETPPHYL